MRAADDDDDDDDGAGKNASTKNAKVDVPLANLTTVIVQNWNRHGARAPMLAPLKLGDKLHYRSNISSVLAALLRNKHSLQWSDDGKALWHPGFPRQVLRWQEPQVGSHMPRSLKAKAPAPKRAGGKRPLGDATNSADSGGAADGAEVDAASACVQPQSLQLQAAPASEKLACGSKRVGTGFGNVADPLQSVCMAEQTMLDRLWVWSNNHGRMCGGALSRIDSDVACWGCHSVGEVNVFRLVCGECDSAFNWTSAAPLPGAPLDARTRAEAAATDAAGAATAAGANGAPTGAGPPNDSTAPPAAAEPPDAAELRRHFRAALAHQQRVRTEYSLSAIAAEISRTSPVSQPSLSRFLNGDTVTSPRRLPPCLSLPHPSPLSPLLPEALTLTSPSVLRRHRRRWTRAARSPAGSPPTPRCPLSLVRTPRSRATTGSTSSGYRRST